MSKSFEMLEQAILDKAMKEPDFMAKLLKDPTGFLKGLAAGKLPPGMRIQKLWELADLETACRVPGRRLRLSH